VDSVDEVGMDNVVVVDETMEEVEEVVEVAIGRTLTSVLTWVCVSRIVVRTIVDV